MYDLMKGMRIVEVSAFIAAPYAGLSLAQMGADIIRIDPIGGGVRLSALARNQRRVQSILGGP